MGGAGGLREGPDRALFTGLGQCCGTAFGRERSVIVRTKRTFDALLSPTLLKERKSVGLHQYSTCLRSDVDNVRYDSLPVPKSAFCARLVYGQS